MKTEVLINKDSIGTIDIGSGGEIGSGENEDFEDLLNSRKQTKTKRNKSDLSGSSKRKVVIMIRN